jgi:hypothetical protein
MSEKELTKKPKTKKDLAKEAGNDLREAQKGAKRASVKFNIIGDPGGKKLADAAADAAGKGADYVEKRLR